MHCSRSVKRIQLYGIATNTTAAYKFRRHLIPLPKVFFNLHFQLKKLVAEISVDLVPKDEGGSENLAADFNGHDAVVTHEESESLVPKDPSPSSPEEPKTIHAVASANDAEQLRQCTPCEQEQEVQ